MGTDSSVLSMTTEDTFRLLKILQKQYINVDFSNLEKSYTFLE